MSYEKKTWVNGETITASGLNNMENGIEALSNIPTVDVVGAEGETGVTYSVNAAALAGVLAKLPHAILIRELYDDVVDSTSITTFGGVDFNSTVTYFKIISENDGYSVSASIRYGISGEMPETCIIIGATATLIDGSYVWSEDY